jgi:hypothetical protein
MMTIINNFFNFIPYYIFWGTIFFNIYILFIFIRCVNKREKISDSLSNMEKISFLLTISYFFAYIFI